jgi:hypothetical protein
MDKEHHSEGNPAVALDRIRSGGNVLCATARSRIIDVTKALDEGDFQEALRAATSLVNKLHHLASAVQSLGSFADAYIVKCDEIEVGQKVVDVGEVTEIDVCEFCKREECQNITLHLAEGGIAVVPRNAELAVERSTD